MAEFQRARSPEQVAERRAEILTAARAMLLDHPLAVISLRELSSQVGLAKSNVLRYFESREAIFLALLDQEWHAWAESLEGQGPPAPADEHDAAAVLARTLASAPLLCELWGALPGVLERNIDAHTARRFKVSSTAHADRVQAWITSTLPTLEAAQARQVAAITALLAGALSAYQRPSPTIAAVTAEFGGLAATPFEDNLRQALGVFLAGLTKQPAPS